MGEYKEDSDSDFNDLIGSDSDEDDRTPVNRVEDNLLSVDDVHISDKPVQRLEKHLLFMPGLMSDSDEEEDEDCKDDIPDPEEERLHKAKLQKMLHIEPPGINLFR